jgi:hypothetical protein
VDSTLLDSVPEANDAQEDIDDKEDTSCLCLDLVVETVSHDAEKEEVASEISVVVVSLTRSRVSRGGLFVTSTTVIEPPLSLEITSTSHTGAGFRRILDGKLMPEVVVEVDLSETADADVDVEGLATCIAVCWRFIPLLVSFSGGSTSASGAEEYGNLKERREGLCGGCGGPTADGENWTNADDDGESGSLVACVHEAPEDCGLMVWPKESTTRWLILDEYKCACGGATGAMFTSVHDERLCPRLTSVRES